MEDKREIVLLVDDNPTSLRAGKAALSGYYDVFTAPSAAKMFALLKNNRPILILLDIEMPDMSGYEVLRMLKDDPATRDIPVIFLTARTHIEDEIQGLHMGAIDYITKPLMPQLLLKRIEIRLQAETHRRRLEHEREELKSVLNMDSEFNHVKDLDILLERILFEARRVVHADAGSIYIPEVTEENYQHIEKLVIKYSQNNTLEKNLPDGEKLVFSVFSIPIDDKTISGYCALTKRMINVADVYHLGDDVPFSYNTSYDTISGYRTKSVLVFPLVTADGRLLGVLQMINACDAEGRVTSFSQNDELLVSHFATNAVFVLQQAYLLRAMILRMIKMAELRDPKETGTHVNRVAGYAVELYNGWARRHGISADEQDKFRDTLRIGAMLHDVGKVAISDMILKKPGRFTPEEYEIMQFHTLYGAGLFHDPLSSLDSIAQDISLSHHENWDGTGYPGWLELDTMRPRKNGEDGKPSGRKGEEIPFTGRIVAIADVYDALCSRRVYKDPWTEDDVLAEMRKMRGTKFDPELLDIFFEVLPNIKLIKTLFPEKEA